MGLLPALLSAIVGAQPAPADRVPPVTLVVTRSPTDVTIQVVGDAQSPVAAAYTLQVAGGSGNRSTQAGTARLVPGTRVVLLTARFGGHAEGDWSATLTVRPDGADAYTLTERGVR